jgi:predicted peroxiredoxin
MNRRSILVAAFAYAALAAPSLAGDHDPLFVNMTTDDPHRAKMALSFSLNQQKRGHPVAIFFNDKGVLVASVKHSETFSEAQKMATEIISAGGQILVCPMCMKHFGVEESELIAGAEIGNPEKTGAALFRDNGKTLTW